MSWKWYQECADCGENRTDCFNGVDWGNDFSHVCSECGSVSWTSPRIGTYFYRGFFKKAGFKYKEASDGKKS